MEVGKLDDAECAFSLAIESRNRPNKRTTDGTSVPVPRAVYHGQRGKVRMLLRDFHGARWEEKYHSDVCTERSLTGRRQIKLQ